MDTTTIISMLGQGLLMTLWIFLWTIVGALPLGLLIALARRSKIKPLAWLMRIYISILRGTPLMLQLLVIYFGPYYLFQLNLSNLGGDYRVTATLIAFILNYAAYFAEIFRSGIDSMPKGQYEAASVLGYTHAQTFFKIIMPQVFKRVLPPITNEVITLVKDTSLAFSIGVAEMFTTAKAIAASTRTMEAFIIAAIFYYLLNALIAFIMGRIEKKMAYYHE